MPPTINSASTDPVEEVLRIIGGGVDHVFDFVGVRSVTEQGLRMLGRGGGLYLVGIGGMDAGVEMATMPAVLNQHRVQAVSMGSSNLKRDLPMYAAFYLQGRMNLDDPVSKEIGLDEINEGYESLKDGNLARVVITNLS
ncbi:zinc-binding dehydrogenase [Streptomyces sp. NPDC096310]|uniref:zinc-binding dehydrogenase n=1 Tax=Streptomyces sp. NPDC096310 TaxID=3366082 RepID=UPI00382C0B98